MGSFSSTRVQPSCCRATSLQPGHVATAGFLLGKHNRLRKFSRFVCRRTASDRPLRVAIGHALCPEAATEFGRHLRTSLPDIHTLTITDLGPALGAHGGPGTIIVATQPFVTPRELVS
jgi:fatty acid-binding protein DegV